jgi:hypothetical protein
MPWLAGNRFLPSHDPQCTTLFTFERISCSWTVCWTCKKPALTSNSFRYLSFYLNLICPMVGNYYYTGR